MILDETLWQLMRDRPFRHRLMSLWLNYSLARQIRGMRKNRGWTQAELARRAGLATQTVVRLERSGASATLSSLCKIATAFDVALDVRFVGWGRLLMAMGETLFIPESFDEEYNAAL